MTITRDKLVTAAMLNQMHPDIFVATPEVLFIQKGWRDIDRIKTIQNFWLDAYNSGIDLEWLFGNDYLNSFGTICSVTTYDSSYTNIDVEATTKKLAQVVKWARSRGYTVTKRYETSDFNIDIEVPDIKGKFTFFTSREVMCVRRHVGTEVVPAQPEQVVDKYDWECERIAFLNIDTDTD